MKDRTRRWVSCIGVVSVFYAVYWPVVEARSADFASGQYQIGDPAIQEVCLKKNGNWYGTTFNFSGRWITYSNRQTLNAALWGNYRIEGHAKHGYANDSLTFGVLNGSLIVTWYDWFDDYSYQQVLLGNPVSFVKSDCDPPFKGVNTHAATQ
jgi:hypothetical protein